MRQPDFDIDFPIGREGEERARQLFGPLLGLGLEGHIRFEVKTDTLAGKYGSVYIEHACLTANGWEHSGIMTTKADVWVFVLPGIFFAVPVPVLRVVHGYMVSAGGSFLKECSRGSHPTKGVAPRLDDLARRCLAESWAQAQREEAA